ncbi:MAG: nucleoside triphosphatase YtkD [Caldibacillus debilis]|uniref:8-oxo-dGTPase n=2 Tax=Caldibacillus debilis TaxID=301148 RepID=A0A420VB87_9BACI|nr:nucleoside triphosphatase YtkD [Caldibacillus debilis]MBO2482544.1 nucleoside triphosphatase YtkD [Bacillaceae bacterium]KYD22268.1 hypothetical protein B4135_1398 [Caldibacillus debilis]MBY6271303.1 nucleoside triphosphatase YtkD [Bacillaceae bacterium]REJ18324.1 MAG: nucleoside triphosphatase YtkD [Caldibacillus debilis]RKO60857.1 8-oxo-dGTPase [Caldibacillus debilis GB1]
MKSFFDLRGQLVRLAFGENPFPQEPKHVFVLCRYRDRWLLTDHKKRGWEFPGGKIEAGEDAKDAAVREVYEETGGVVDRLVPIGQYQVFDEREAFVKKIFFATIREIRQRPHYHETNGPLLVDEETLAKPLNDRFSFLMRDSVVAESIRYLKENRLPDILSPEGSENGKG